MSNSTTTTTTTTPTPATTTNKCVTPTTTLSKLLKKAQDINIGLTIAFPVVTISLAIALVITCFKWKGSQNAKNHTAESHELAEPNPQDSASRRVIVSGSTEASESLLDSNNGEANNTES
ncbi:hypothetical protein EB796_024979 [Bugula neritina]|uniref:Uncharacterized protein n=1 Tax=Bugula neritina TaxID=10212 RepID=A0A7J7ITI5_BUGNE|nr:hypothetical protein EB796_024979 [Bugula neritina]